ncbi:MAG: hypothetical protein KJ737_05370 [Proteobacteria bacterium]|nr:hypothetical protein [Pseudomonadota bacterium]
MGPVIFSYRSKDLTKPTYTTLRRESPPISIKAEDTYLPGAVPGSGVISAKRQIEGIRCP